MKKILLGLYLFSGLLFANNPEIQGFRDVAFGLSAGAGQLKNSKEIKTYFFENKKTKKYDMLRILISDSEIKQIGEVSIDRVIYFFLNDKLFNVRIEVKDLGSYDKNVQKIKALAKEVIKEYPIKQVNKEPEYIYNDGKNNIRLVVRNENNYKGVFFNIWEGKYWPNVGMDEISTLLQQGKL